MDFKSSFRAVRKRLGKVTRFIQWLFDMVGIAASLVGFIATDGTFAPLWKILFGVFVFNTIMWAVVGAYEYGTAIQLIQTKDQKDIAVQEVTESKDAIIKDLKEKLASAEDIRVHARNFICLCNDKLNRARAELWTAETEYLNRLEEQAQKSGLDKVDINGESADVFLRKEIDRNHKATLLRIYNTFLGDIFGSLKILLEMRLKEKGVSLPVSLCLKQFDCTVDKNEDMREHFVAATFRDSVSYKTREIGKRYKVKGNTAFEYCLTERFFLKNNITKEDKAYSNKNPKHPDTYNCTIVVPVSYRIDEQCDLYGYLACDTLNPDLEKKDIFDDSMAQICIFVSQIIGLLFNTMSIEIDAPLGDKDCINTITSAKREARNMMMKENEYECEA